MASLVIPTLTLSLPTTPARACFKPPHVLNSPSIRFAADQKTRRGLTVVTGAGPSMSSIAFAIALPLSLLAGTIFTSIKIADKLDRDYLEELIIDQAIREAEEYDSEEEDDEEGDDDDSEDIPLEEKVQQQQPALSDGDPEEKMMQQLAIPRTRTRNRPKREA